MLTLTATGLPAVVYGRASAPIALALVLSDSNPLYTSAMLKVTWGSGSPVQMTVALPYSSTLYASLPTGVSLIKVTAVTTAAPTHSTSYTAVVEVSQAAGPVATHDPVLFGPIPPRISGSPGINDWTWNTAGDSTLLEASVVSILLTRRGERVMRPTYGSNLHALIFAPATIDLNAAVQEEIKASVGSQESNVTLIDAKCDVEGRTARVTATFRSKLDSVGFVLSLPFSK